mmetsp:Transcript_10836/g.30849  ORF Transcript_10836/g.30849 Transcript_10836/m.30849 type:complete len:363 (+) Transcript_10836:214-1302(+)
MNCLAISPGSSFLEASQSFQTLENLWSCALPSMSRAVTPSLPVIRGGIDTVLEEAAGLAVPKAPAPSNDVGLSRWLRRSSASRFSIAALAFCASSSSSSSSATLRRQTRPPAIRDAAPPLLSGVLRKLAAVGSFRERWVLRRFVLRCGCLHWLEATRQRADGKPSSPSLSGSSFVNFSRTPCEVCEGSRDDEIVVRPVHGWSWSKEDSHGHIDTGRSFTLRADDPTIHAMWVSALRAHMHYGWAGTSPSGESDMCCALSNLGDAGTFAPSSTTTSMASASRAVTSWDSAFLCSRGDLADAVIAEHGGFAIAEPDLVVFPSDGCVLEGPESVVAVEADHASCDAVDVEDGRDTCGFSLFFSCR